MNWGDPRNERLHDRVRTMAHEDGFSPTDTETHYIDKISRQTKSRKALRLIRLAYYLGWMRGIAYVDQMRRAVTLAATDEEVPHETN